MVQAAMAATGWDLAEQNGNTLVCVRDGNEVFVEIGSQGQSTLAVRPGGPDHIRRAPGWA